MLDKVHTQLQARSELKLQRSCAPAMFGLSTARIRVVLGEAELKQEHGGAQRWIEVSRNVYCKVLEIGNPRCLRGPGAFVNL
jgi:hypothetical protein